MCEGEYCIVCFVGYGLPIGCCLAGGAMTCYGCYRYYFLTNQRRLHEQQNLQQRRQQTITNQPKKADTLKRKMLNKFLATMDKIHGIDTPDTSDPSSQQSTSTSPVKSGESCPICFEDYDGDPNGIFMGVVKSCKHYYHFECLWEWLEHNSSCPLCRTTTTLTESDIMGVSLQDVCKLFPDVQQNDVKISHHPSVASMLALAQQQQMQETGDQTVKATIAALSEVEAQQQREEHMGIPTVSATVAFQTDAEAQSHNPENLQQTAKPTPTVSDSHINLGLHQSESTHPTPSTSKDDELQDGICFQVTTYSANSPNSSNPADTDIHDETMSRINPSDIQEQSAPHNEPQELNTSQKRKPAPQRPPMPQPISKPGPTVVQVEPEVPTMDRGHTNVAFEVES